MTEMAPTENTENRPRSRREVLRSLAQVAAGMGAGLGLIGLGAGVGWYARGESDQHAQGASAERIRYVDLKWREYASLTPEQVPVIQFPADPAARGLPRERRQFIGLLGIPQSQYDSLVAVDQSVGAVFWAPSERPPHQTVAHVGNLGSVTNLARIADGTNSATGAAETVWELGMTIGTGSLSASIVGIAANGEVRPLSDVRYQGMIRAADLPAFNATLPVV